MDVVSLEVIRFSIWINASEIANRPITKGRKGIPPCSSETPKLYLLAAERSSNPMDAKNTPIRPAMIPFNG